MTAPRPLEVSVSLDALFHSFSKRMNPPETVPPHFNHAKRLADDARVRAMPGRSKPSRFPALNELLILADIEAGKLHLEKHIRSNSASGPDRCSYIEVLELDNKQLLAFLNYCIQQREIPYSWLLTIIISIPKRGRPLDVPDSYRAVGLESCLLKFLTLVIHLKLFAVLEANGLLPASQNGFRAGYRTNNNAFILRTLIDQALADDSTLYVTFVDISNAFPSLSHNLLWLRMESLGLTGIYFDWLRLLYASMEYVVSSNGEVSAAFNALMGVLMGDPASPTLWNILMAAISLPRHNDDVVLLPGVLLSHLEHADDTVIISRSTLGMQAHLNSMFRWCANVELLINAIKSVAMVFGPLPRTLPIFLLGNDVVPFKEAHSYIGVIFRSTHANYFFDHYEKKAATARNCSRSIFSIESLIGNEKIPPKIGCTLYTALVDCHLTHGCEVIIDVHKPSLLKLQKVQRYYLRRLLCVSSHSVLAPLFSETGLLPIEYRRIILVLRFLLYLRSLPHDRFAYMALEANIILVQRGKSCWLQDLRIALAALPEPLALPNDILQCPVDILTELPERVKRIAGRQLLLEINCSSRLYVLHNRLEPQEDGPARIIHRTLRHYLTEVCNPKHRKAVTGLLLGQHIFAIERLRWTNAAHKTAVPREFRLCRRCRMSVETPEHAILQCTFDAEIVKLRNAFRATIACIIDTPLPTSLSEAEALHWLKRIIFHWDLIPITARFIHDIIKFWDATPLYRLPRPY